MTAITKTSGKSSHDDASAVTDSPSEVQFRQLVNELPDAILVHSRGRIVFVNPSCLTLLRAHNPEQLIGKDIAEFIDPEHLPAINHRIEDCYSKRGNNPPMENVLITLDGSRVPTEATAIFIAWEGRPAIEVVLRDISQRKKAEERLRQYERVVEGLA